MLTKHLAQCLVCRWCSGGRNTAVTLTLLVVTTSPSSWELRGWGCHVSEWPDVAKFSRSLLIQLLPQAVGTSVLCL